MQATTKGETMNNRPSVRIHAATQPADMDWVLAEPVDVTLVKQTSDGSETIVLVTRTVQAGACTLAFMDNGDILVNGVYRDLGDDMMEYCSITDELLMGPLPTVGDTVRSYPDKDLKAP